MKEMDYWVFKTNKVFAIHCLSTLLYSLPIAQTWHFPDVKFGRMKEMDYWVFKTKKVFAKQSALCFILIRK